MGYLDMKFVEHETTFKLNPDVKNLLNEAVDINIERISTGEKIMTLTNWVIQSIFEFSITVDYWDKDGKFISCFDITSSMSPENDINVIINRHNDDSTVYELFISEVSENVNINTLIRPNCWYKLLVKTETFEREFCILVYEKSATNIKFKYYDARKFHYYDEQKIDNYNGRGGIVEAIEYTPLNGSIEIVESTKYAPLNGNTELEVENNMLVFIPDDKINICEYFKCSDIFIEEVLGLNC